jgi:hypothetical protein
MNRRLLTVVAGSALVALAAPARADLTELKWATEGYFRTRTVTLSNLAPQPRVVTTYPGNGEQLIIPDIRSTSYVVSRLRLMPSLQFGKQVRMNFQIDALDDILWGDNNGLSTAPLFATRRLQPGLPGRPGRRLGDDPPRLGAVPGAGRPDARRADAVALGHGPARQRRRHRLDGSREPQG